MLEQQIKKLKRKDLEKLLLAVIAKANSAEQNSIELTGSEILETIFSISRMFDGD